MRAITEIPAKTARPIGRTESCFPGIWNAGVLDVAESAWEVPDGTTDEDDPDGFDGFPPWALPGVGAGPALLEVADADDESEAEPL